MQKGLKQNWVDLRKPLNSSFLFICLGPTRETPPSAPSTILLQKTAAPNPIINSTKQIIADWCIIKKNPKCPNYEHFTNAFLQTHGWGASYSLILQLRSPLLQLGIVFSHITVGLCCLCETDKRTKKEVAFLCVCDKAREYSVRDVKKDTCTGYCSSFRGRGLENEWD